MYLIFFGIIKYTNTTIGKNIKKFSELNNILLARFLLPVHCDQDIFPFLEGYSYLTLFLAFYPYTIANTGSFINMFFIIL